MYAAIRIVQGKSGAMQEVARRIEESYVPMLRTAPGFVAYSLVHYGNDAGQSITIFETQAQAEAYQLQGHEWVKEHLLPLLTSPPERRNGEVLIHVDKKTGN